MGASVGIGVAFGVGCLLKRCVSRLLSPVIGDTEGQSEITRCTKCECGEREEDVLCVFAIARMELVVAVHIAISWKGTQVEQENWKSWESDLSVARGDSVRTGGLLCRRTARATATFPAAFSCASSSIRIRLVPALSQCLTAHAKLFITAASLHSQFFPRRSRVALRFGWV